MSPVIDLTGQTFGRLTALSRADNIRREAAWACRCECGEVVTVRGYSLRCGATASCGCRQREVAATLIGAAVAVANARRKKPDAEISYRSAHRRVERAKGLASIHSCIDCAGRAQDWSLRRDAADVHLAKNGESMCSYSGNPEDYEPRCRNCHAIYDRE